ncbi:MULTISPECIES: 16S rRNA (guanine(966)-N(2))-methyltransferase RsmD [Sorangium]|uniref:Methyltransferase n=1 Tax=Sorangium cellulosum TaxID=56 RepID=A0A4P2R3U7_SORCE|nr:MULTISPECIES: 16S rRNA (guanine(966)-N(2))-methyltransferase RsmD [Sorangium]AUX37416.1 methyltransferase [Sorangium cellulosum]WCQ96703.1 Ribosomal RNA small subunit methyltransferase D [Sorangium sp. Soce836]
MRVIAGRLGGRRLAAPRGEGTRPTADRVREALFSSLGDITGALVCDLYAGTGALGIEALSRGARRAVFVESGRPALATLRENLAALGLADAARVVPLPVERALDLLADEGPFDLALLDPPYAALAKAAAAAARLAGPLGLLAPTGRLVLEHARRDPSPEIAGLTCAAIRTYGDTAVSFYER